MPHPQVVLLTLSSGHEDTTPAALPLADAGAIVSRTVTPASAGDTLSGLGDGPFAAIILDCRCPCQELLTAIRALAQSASTVASAVIVLGENDAHLAVQAIKAGASDYWVRDRITAEQLSAILPDTPVQSAHPGVSAASTTAVKKYADCFRLLAETIQDVFWITDFRIPEILYVSPAYETVWGRSPAELYNNYSAWAETIHPDDRDRVLAVATGALHQQGATQEYRIIRPDGTVRWIRDRGFAVRGADGEYPKWVGIAQDITEHKLAEAALAKNEARLQGFVESNVVGILYGDIHGNVFEANDELLRMVGYTRDDLTRGRLQWKAMTPPEYTLLDERKCAEAQLSGACTPFEKEYIRKDGTRVPILIGFSLLGERREESVCFVLDLSDRRKVNRALRRSEDRLRMALESAQLGTWDWNLITNKLTWDERCKAMFGMSPKASVTIDKFFQALHPDDQERLQQQVTACMNSATGGDYDVEYRTIGIEDGIERWILAKGKAYFDAAGTPVRFIGTVLDITERKRTETALRDSRERLEMAIEGSGSGFWDWNIVTNEDYLSPEWLAMLGFDAGELPAEYSSWERLIHPEDKATVMDKLQAHLQDGGQSYRFEYRLMTKSGDWKWIANYGKVVRRDEAGKPLRMAGIHVDISDRKQAEEQVRLSEARYRTLSNAVSQLMWIGQPDGKIIFFNQQWVDYTGIDNLELGVDTWPAVLHPEDFAAIHRVRTAAIASKTAYEVEARIKRADQTYRWHLARVAPMVDDAGEVINWFGTATDIHDRKLTESVREHLLNREQAARAAAERANRVKDEFLAILSHELRSPLNPILGWSQLLQTREFNRAKTLQALEVIERNAKLQTQLVDDLLDVAKILRGKLKLDRAPVDLVQVISAALETVKTAAVAKSIGIEPHLKAVGNVWGDDARLQQIVWNLLSNAIKFTPASGQVAIKLAKREGRAVLEVTDTGIGIQQAFLAHIFESFRQEDVSITREHGGLGLGLAISRHLAEAHGGTISAESPGKGQGATFRVSLPLMPSDVVFAGSHDQLSRDSSLAGVRVLAVDDDPDCRHLLSAMLEEYEAEVVTLASAKEALARFLDFKPDILISDLGMPNFDGYSLLKQIRSLSEASGGQVPAIALTAYTRQEDQQKALSRGFQRHIAKPIEVDVVVQAIAELVKSRP